MPFSSVHRRVYGSIIQACVDREIPFLCEKPPAQSLDEAREIVRILKGSSFTASGSTRLFSLGGPLGSCWTPNGRELTRNLADWFYLKEKPGYR